MDTPSGLQSKITPDTTPKSPYIITSYEESISSQPNLPLSLGIDCIPQPLTNVSPTKPSNATLNKNSI